MSVGQYLQHYAEPEIHEFSALQFYYENVLTIPAFDEPESLVSRLKQLNSPDSLLIILVINAPIGCDKVKLQATQNLAKRFKQDCLLIEQYSSTVALLELSEKPKKHLLLVERCVDGYLIPLKEGVGLARKIANDIACKAIASGSINSTWIHNTDADVTLPAHYFNASKTLNPTEVAVALYPFEHIPSQDKQINLYQQLYDISLYYYVEGLRMANSPYAFHTVGSTLLINFHAYALVRGFPKRSAGEDFYLLNKIAKISDVVSMEKPLISIDSRTSDRVPFGTGPALIKISELENPLEDYRYYNPLCFKYLKLILELIPSFWDKQSQIISTSSLEELTPNPNNLDLKLLSLCLEKLKTAEALQHALQNSRKPENYMRHMHNWFDAFKTLKFIHYVRDELTQCGQTSVVVSVLSQEEFISAELRDKCQEANFI